MPCAQLGSACSQSGRSYVKSGIWVGRGAEYLNKHPVRSQPSCQSGLVRSVCMMHADDKWRPAHAHSPVLSVTACMLQESGLPWTLGLTRKLQGAVQLVAPTISCSRIHGIGPPSLDGVHESVPHVSWQAFAMTQVRLTCLSWDVLSHCCTYDTSAPHASWQASAMTWVRSAWQAGTCYADGSWS